MPVRPASRLATVLVLLPVVVAACRVGPTTTGSAGTGPATLASPTASIEPSASAASSAPSIAPSASAAPVGSATPAPTASPAEPPATASPDTGGGDTMLVRAYFLLADQGDGEPTLVPVLREMPASKAVARASLTALLAGPSAAERRAEPPISTLIPAGTKLLAIAVADGTATVDLSAAFVADADRRVLTGRMAEVVYTLTQFSRVDRVRFEIDGAAVDATSGRWDRADFRDDWLPTMWVDRPAWGAALEHETKVTGLANVFEAQFRIAVLDRDGDVLVDEQVQATCGSGCWGRFSVAVPYDVPSGRWGTLRVWDPSERDGSPEGVRDYPVWLTPD